ncbi:uncharacterized protein LOC128243098 [Mya arenaria]|uniref:uncharacterized protein LOC128243098 n=1 Tax=Mya arenaria TaxID=6604 RepID=UPI0022E92855|nr:uncharacterized protein LOC128243098 [Mya arenaria]
MMVNENGLINMDSVYDGNGTEYSDDELYDRYHDYYIIVPTPAETFVHYFYLIVFPYFLFFGTFGNIISTALLSRYSHNVWSTCVYMTLIFPLDLIKLYVECGNDWIEEVTHKELNLSAKILLMSNAVCKVYTFVYSLLLQEVRWVIVAIAIETMIVLKTPTRIYNMCTRERANAIMLFISVMLITLDLHFFWTHGLVRPGDDPSISFFMCTYVNELSDNFRDYIWPNINFFIEELIPFCIILGCIIVSITGLVRKSSRVNDNYLEKYFLDTKALRELSKAMFVVCIVSFLSTMCDIIEISVRVMITNGILAIEYEQNFLMINSLAVSKYIFVSHKFWIFYVFCERFRNDVKNFFRALCTPFKWRSGRKLNRRYVRESQEREAELPDSETRINEQLVATFSENNAL